MSRQNIPCDSILQKVNALDVVPFEKDVLFLQFDQWLQQRANPCDERNGPVNEKLYVFEGAFKNKECHLQPQILWQSRNKSHHVLNIILKLVLYGLLNIFIQLQR